VYSWNLAVKFLTETADTGKKSKNRVRSSPVASEIRLPRFASGSHWWMY
jgi:hypothetical protein